MNYILGGVAHDQPWLHLVRGGKGYFVTIGFSIGTFPDLEHWSLGPRWWQLLKNTRAQVRGGWLWSGKAAEQATIRVNIDSWPDRPLQLSALSQENNSMLFDISFYVFHFCLFYADELILFRSIREDVRDIYRVFSSGKRGRWIFQWKYGKYIMWYLVTYV